MITPRLAMVPAVIAGTMSLAACGSASMATPSGAESVATAADTAGQAVTNPVASVAQVTPPTGAVAKTPAEAFVAGGPRFVAAAAVVQAVAEGSPEIVFIDARPPTDYEFGHIPGAINVPYYETEQHLGKLPKDKWLVAYCECPHAEAEQVAQTLESAGFTQVRVIDEGLQGWRDQGREVVAGTGPNG